MKASSLGRHYQRPLEHHIERFTNSWQASQPLHLRHLAIVRDTAQTKKFAHYIHLSYDNFQKKVDAGETSWEVVETTQSDTKKKPRGWHAIGAEPELDEYGFAPIPASRFAGKNGDATLLESVLAASVPPQHLTTFDPLVFLNESGSYGLYLLRTIIGHVLTLRQSSISLRRRVVVTQSSQFPMTLVVEDRMLQERKEILGRSWVDREKLRRKRQKRLGKRSPRPQRETSLLQSLLQMKS